MRHLPLLLILSLACVTNDPEAQGTDADEDGVTVEAGDCNDDDPTISPLADEDCSEVDRNCSGDALDDMRVLLTATSESYGGESSGFGVMGYNLYWLDPRREHLALRSFDLAPIDSRRIELQNVGFDNDRFNSSVTYDIEEDGDEIRVFTKRWPHPDVVISPSTWEEQRIYRQSDGFLTDIQTTFFDAGSDRITTRNREYHADGWLLSEHFHSKRAGPEVDEWIVTWSLDEGSGVATGVLDIVSDGFSGYTPPFDGVGTSDEPALTMTWDEDGYLVDREGRIARHHDQFVPYRESWIHDDLGREVLVTTWLHPTSSSWMDRATEWEDDLPVRITIMKVDEDHEEPTQRWTFEPSCAPFVSVREQQPGDVQQLLSRAVPLTLEQLQALGLQDLDVSSLATSLDM